MQVLTNYGQITGYSSLKSWIRHYGAPPTPLAMNVRNSRPTILQCQKTDCLVLPILIHKKAKILNKRIEYILFRICYVYYFCYSWKSLSIAITSVGIHLRYCKDVISLEMRNWKLLLFCSFSRVQTYWIATNAQTYLGSVTVYCSDFTETSVTVMNVLQNKNAFQQGAYRGISVQRGVSSGGSRRVSIQGGLCLGRLHPEGYPTRQKVTSYPLLCEHSFN